MVYNSNKIDVTGNSKINIEYIYYILYFIIGVYLGYKDINLTVVIGDNGSFTPVLFFSLAVVAIKWIPYIAITGFLMSTQKQKMPDVLTVYNIFTLILMVSTLLMLYIAL